MNERENRERTIRNRIRLLWYAEIDAEDEMATESAITQELARFSGLHKMAKHEEAAEVNPSARETVVEQRGIRIDVYQHEPGITVFSIQSGNSSMDICTSWPVRDAFLQWLDDNDVPEWPINVVVDLSGLELLDSTALGVLAMFRNRLRLHGGWVSLVCPVGSVRKFFRLAGFDKLFGIYDSIDEAAIAIHDYMQGPVSRFTWPR
ncbi:STAS domain-containing protein [Actinomadura welshii]|uniref:STAS domain-containing protein n=1 Tax=Actinomadura welshii TaxID=3103817 RepID=UPI0003ACEC24|nr:STAS domain-containing protein [Actinomadura madurae]